MGLRVPTTKTTAENTPSESINTDIAPTYSNPETRPPLLRNSSINESESLTAGVPTDIYREVMNGETKPSAPSTAATFSGVAQTEIGGIPKDIYDESINKSKQQPDDLYAPRILARTVDSTQAQNIITIAEKLNMTTSEASAYLTEHPMDELKAIPELTNLQRDYPGVTTWAKNPDNYKVLLKDPAWAKRIEDHNKKINGTLSEDLSKYAGDASRAILGGISAQINAPLMKALGYTYNLGAYPINQIMKSVGMPEQQVEAPEWLINNPMAKYYDEQTKLYQVDGLDKDVIDSLSEKISSGNYAGAGRDLSLRLMQNAPSQIMSVYGVMAKIPAVTLGAMGFFQGTSTFVENRKAGADISSATLNSMYSGAFETIMESMETLSIFHHWEQSLTKTIGKDSAKKVLRSMVSSLAYSAAVEGSSEAATQVLQDFSEYATGVNPKGLEGIGKRAAGAGLIGAISGMAITSPGAAAHGYVRTQNIENRKIIERVNSAITAMNARDEVRQGREDKKGSTVPNEHPQQTQELHDFIDAQKGKEKIKTPPFEVYNSEEPPPIPPSRGEKLPLKNEETTIQDNAVKEGLVAESTPRPTFVQFNIKELTEVAGALGRTIESVVRELGDGAHKSYTSAVNNNDVHFNMDYSDYYRYSDALAELDDIMYVNGKEDNFNSAKDSLDTLNKKAEDLRLKKEDGTVNDEGVQPEGEPQEGDPVLREIKLIQKQRTPEQRTVWRKIKNSLTSALQSSGIKPAAIDILAELQFKHTRFRAEQLGLPISEVESQLKIKEDVNMEEGVFGYFDPSSGFLIPNSNIYFGKNTEAHVVIHEFAHSWLHNMTLDWHYISGLGTRTENQQDYYEAMKYVADMFGMTDVTQLLDSNRADYKKIHETFAQTAEKYFLEGNFENSKIKKVMESMRMWMIDVANSIASMMNMNYPPLEINPQISRMFQTIVEGNSKIEEHVTPMFIEPLFDPKLLGSRADRYTKAIADARDAAIAEVYSKFYNKEFKDREKLIHEAIDSIYEEANATVEDRPAIKLMRGILGTGERSRITYESIFEVLAEKDPEAMKAIKDITPSAVIAGQKKAGVDIRDIMQYMGIDDPKLMIEILKEMGNRDQLVEDIAKKIIDEKFPLMKTDEEIHNIAVEAINNAGKEKILEIELRELAENHLRTLQQMSATTTLSPEVLNRASVKYIKATALTSILNSVARGLRSEDFLKEMGRYSKQAAKAVEEGDYQKAFDAKQAEAIAYYKYKYSRSAVSLVNKVTAAIKGMKSISMRSISKTHDPDIYNYGKSLINELENEKQLSFLNINNLKNKYVFDPSRLNLINSYVREVNNMMLDSDGNRRRTSNMTTEAYTMFGKLLSTIRAASSATRFVEVENKKIAATFAADLIRDEIGPRKSTDPTTSMMKGIKASWQSGLINFRTLIAGMYETEEGFAQSLLGKLINGASDSQARLISEREIDEKVLLEAVAKIAKNNPEAQSLFYALTRRMVDLKNGEKSTPIHAAEINHTFANEGEVIQMILYLGSESGRIKMAKGGFKDSITGKETGMLGFHDPSTGEFKTPNLDVMIKRMMEDGTITKEHMDFAQTIWNIYERHHEPSKDAIRKVMGHEIGKIEARTFSTPWGDYKGGYTPVSVDQSFMDLDIDLSDFSTDNPVNFVQDLYPSTSTSFANERSKKYYPVSLDLARLRSRLNAVYRVAYMMPSMFELGKILSNKDLHQAIEARRPGAMKAVIVPWFKRTMAQQYAVPSEYQWMRAITPMVHKLRSNNRIAAFAFNYKTILKQYIGVVPATGITGTKHMASALAEIGFNPKKYTDLISESNPRMKQRMENNAKMHVKSMEDLTLNFDKIDKLRNKIDVITYGPIQWTQNHVDAAVFMAAVNQAEFDFKMTNTDDINNYAASVVERTQMSSNISDRPTIMHGSEVQRLFTDFMSVPLAMYGLNYESKMRNLGESKTKQMEVFIKQMIITIVLPSVLATVIDKPFKAVRAVGGEDDEEYLKNMALDVANEALGVIAPIAGRVMNNILAIFDHSGTSGIMPAAGVIKKTGQATRAAISPINPFDKKHKISPSDVRAMIDAVTTISGIPVSGVNKLYKLAIDIDPSIDRNQKHR